MAWIRSATFEDEHLQDTFAPLAVRFTKISLQSQFPNVHKGGKAGLPGLRNTM